MSIITHIRRIILGLIIVAGVLISFGVVIFVMVNYAEPFWDNYIDWDAGETLLVLAFTALVYLIGGAADIRIAEYREKHK